MGAWDAGPFDNDHAADFVDDLVDLADGDDVAGAVRAALHIGAGPEAPDASIAVAAAALVAHAVSGTRPGSPSAAELIDRGVVPTDVDTVVSARAALDAVLAPDSELRELWDEAGSLDELTAALGEVRGRLG